MTGNQVWSETMGHGQRKGWGRGGVEESEAWPYRSATFHTVGAIVLAVVGAGVVGTAFLATPESLCR